VDVVPSGDERVVVFRGELDMAAAGELWRCVERVCGSSRSVTIDLAGTTFMDSSGVNVLLRAYKAQGRVAEGVTLRSPSRAVLHTLALTGIGDMFRIDDGPPAGA
jgi:anti-anti-sigma factor